MSTPYAPPLPPAPPPPPAKAKGKTPAWVWVLAGVSILFLIGLYVLIYFGFGWGMGLVRQEFARSYPEFEFEYITNKGGVRMRHKASGKVIVFLPEEQQGKGSQLRLSVHATQPAPGPLPEWVKVDGAAPAPDRENAFEVPRMERDDLYAELMERAERQGYRVEQVAGVDRLAACDHKTLTCVGVQLTAGANGGSEYEARQTRVP